MSKDSNPIKKNLEDKFRQLLPKEDAPEELKQEVFNTLDMLNLVGDVVDLFTAKFSKTEASFFDLLEEDEEDNDNSETEA